MAILRTWGLGPAHVDLTVVRAPRPVELTALPQNLTIDVSTTAIVVDMQNDFCVRGGWLESIGVDVSPAYAAVVPLQAILPSLRAAGCRSSG